MSAGVGIQLSGAESDSSAQSLRDAVSKRLDGRAARVDWEGHLANLSASATTQLTQLVLPLVGNALDACDDQKITVALSEQPEALSIEVRDAGSGMSEEVLSRSVEPFFTTKAPGFGMGLGLHLVRVVSDAMGGQLALTSVPGRGTSARLVLPRASLGVRPGDSSWLKY